MNFKRILSLFLVLVTLLVLSSCGEVTKGNTSENISGVSENKKTVNYMTLLYSAADTFNPYTAKTNINRQLCMLLYEPLVKINNEFEPVYSLAKSVVTKGKKCTVKIRNAKFSDGSSVTADDIVYSCKLALKAKNSYSAKLYEVKSVSASDSKTVVFTLKKADRYFINLLDFPIIKIGSDKKTDSDSVIQPPIGCGRYKVSKDKLSLVINSKYFGEKGSIKKIKLINAPDSESVSHYAQIGAADMYYSDISDGNILRISGKKYNVNLNNLVYIGFNHNNSILSKSTFRHAVSSGIDRNAICRDSYYNNAIAATGFFNPVWKLTSSVQNIQINANQQITVENLEKIGYNRLDSRGLRVNSSGNGLNFTLLVNSENRIRVSAAQKIAENLSAYGIKINIVEKKFSAYKKALKKGDFDMYIGEVKITDNMDLSSLIDDDGSAAFGHMIKEKSSSRKNADNKSKTKKKTATSYKNCQKVINGFYKGKNNITDIATVLQSEMPIVPVCYRTGVLFCNDNIENINLFSASDIYFSVESYIINQ